MCSRFALNTVMQKHTGKGEGHGWVIEDTAVFTSDECTNAISHMDGKIRFSPLKKSRYLIHIPYDLCTLTKYHG